MAENRLEAKSICFCVVETWQTAQSLEATVQKIIIETLVHHLLGNDTSSNFLSSQESLRSRSASASKSPSQKAQSSSVLGCGEGKIATATAAATSSVPRRSPSREVEDSSCENLVQYFRSRRGRTRGQQGVHLSSCETLILSE